MAAVDPVGTIAGRDEEREACLAAIRAVAETGEGRLLAIHGPQGIGKTTLVDAVLDECSELVSEEHLEENPEENLEAHLEENTQDRPGDHSDGITSSVVKARCDDSATPFQPIRRLLSGIDDVDPFTRAGLDLEDHQQYLAQRTGLFDDIVSALVPTDGPSRVVVLEDIHLADRETITFLEYLIERLDHAPLAVLLTYRPGELSASAAEVLGETSSDEPEQADREVTEAIQLGPLDTAATRAIVERTVGQVGAPEALIQAVQERTSGNPLYIEGTIEGLLAEDRLDEDYQSYPGTAEAIDLPQDVPTAVEAQLAEIDGDARRVLSWLAIAGETAPVALIDAVLDLEPGNRQAICEAMFEAGVLDWEDSGQSVTFRRAHVREALNQRLSAEEKQFRHEVIATSLAETVFDDDEPARWLSLVAAHYKAAEQYDSAARYYLEAGNHAGGVYAQETAIDMYNQAVTLGQGAGADETTIDAMERLGRAYQLVGDFGAGIECYQYLRHHADEPETVQEACRNEGYCRYSRDDFEGATDCLEKAMAIAQARTDRAGVARIHNDLGMVAMSRGDFRRAHRHQERARSLAEEAEDSALTALALKDLGVIAYRQGRFDRAVEHYSQALEYARESGNEIHETLCLEGVGIAYIGQREFETARGYLLDALERKREIGFRAGQATTLVNLGVASTRLGELWTAREYFEEARTRHSQAGNLRGQALVETNIAGIDHRLGHLERAKRTAELGLAGYRECGDTRGETGALGTLAKIHVSLWDTSADGKRETAPSLESAREYASRGVELARSVGAVTEAELLNTLGLVELAAGNHAAAAEALEASLDCATRHDHDTVIAEAEGYLGVARIGQGDAENGRRMADGALDTLSDLDAFVEALSVIHRYLTIELDRGSEAKAGELCRHAHEYLDTLDADLAPLRKPIEQVCRELDS